MFVLLQEHPTKSHSTCSDGSLLSMGSSEMDEVRRNKNPFWSGNHFKSFIHFLLHISNKIESNGISFCFFAIERFFKTNQLKALYIFYYFVANLSRALQLFYDCFCFLPISKRFQIVRARTIIQV